jgi:hypothetical protein
MVILHTVRHTYHNGWDVPRPRASAQEREAFANEVRRQLPAFFWKLEHLVIPDRFIDHRFGIKPYCSPIVRALLEKDLPGNQLMRVIYDSSIFKDGRPYREATAREWMAILQPMYWSAHSPVEMGRIFTSVVERSHSGESKRTLDGRELTRVMNPDLSEGN